MPKMSKKLRGIEELAGLVKLAAICDGLLDEIVTEVARDLAAQVNTSGFPAQVRFLGTVGGYDADEIDDTIKMLLGRRHTDAGN